MDVEEFHRLLLGIDQKLTPEQFRLSWEAQQLYKAHADRDVRGFSTEVNLAGFPDSHTPERRFLATFVLGLTMTEGERPVCVAIPRQRTDWVLDQIKEIARYVFRARRGNVAAIMPLRKAIQQLGMASRVLQMPEPERWVSYGFHHDDPLPEWMKGKLL